MKIPKISTWTKRFIMALVVLAFSFTYIFVITLVSGAKPNDIIIGSILTCLATILNFFFGSSDRKGKDDKDPVIPNKPPMPVIQPEDL